MRETFIVLSKAGANRDHAKRMREQPFWDEHAAFIDGLIEEGFIRLGGPLVDEGGAVLVVHADSEEVVRDKWAGDPWYEHEILELASIKRWQILVDKWT